IERDARETAKEAAKREGMTVGEWLNQIIYSAGSGEETEGEIEGLKLRDIVTAVEHLNKRIAEADAKNADALGSLSRNIGGVVERVQRLERVKPAEGTHADLQARIEKLEQAGGDKQRIEALKALEKAVAQVAAQFSTAHKSSLERLDANEKQIEALAARVEAAGPGDSQAEAAGPLRAAIDALTERVARAEGIAREASALKAEAGASIDPEFVERTGERLRVLGDEIKRGGDQIRDLEATIAKLSDQIDAAERRSAEGVQKVADTISELHGRIADGGPAAAAADAPSPAASSPAAEAAAETRDDDAATNAAREAAAPETDSDNEDPFAFADEIEAAIDEPSAPGEDFSFDFDDDGESGGDSDDERSEGRNEARALLDEVEQVFGKRDAAPSADEGDKPAQDKADDDDLDALLAGLEDGADAQASAPASSEDAEKGEERQAAKAMLFGGGATRDQLTAPAAEADEDDAPKEDFLQAARRRAKEAAEENAAQKRTRRNLTPKQRAILAVRARQKRLAANSQPPDSNAPFAPGNEKRANRIKPTGPAAAAKATPSKPLDHAPSTQVEDGDDAAPEAGGVSKLLSAASAMRAKLPFQGKADDDADEATPPDAAAKPADADGEPVDGNKAAFATLKSTAAARPVTLALGVAIFLAAAALFFLVKDLVMKPAAPNASRPTVTAAPEQTTPPAAQAAIETPSAALADASETINPRTLYLEAMTALSEAASSDESAGAIRTLEEAAALGHPPAQLQLGELYKTGQGVDQDLGQARTWFRRAANGGNVLAMHRIGVMTARGDGGPADTAEAVGWFELAANRGLVDSQYNLGAIYHPSDTGGAAPLQDAGKAYYWYSLAAKNGDQQAPELAAGVGSVLSADERSAVDADVAAWEAETVDEEANEMAAVAVN
ncbi:MAG: SEL1-like repeat protein, partial [Hyphococcus sp.]